MFKEKKSEPPTKYMSREEQLNAEAEEYLEKKTMLGNITFIGELYKIGMLREKIMHECITRLFGDMQNPQLVACLYIQYSL
jgi:translation initiation factor 4G